jgi:hypothetical protein
VGIPRPPGPDLVLIEPGFVLGLLEAFLDPPPRPRRSTPGQANRSGGVGCRRSRRSRRVVIERLASSQCPRPARPADADWHRAQSYSRGPCASAPTDNRRHARVERPLQHRHRLPRLDHELHLVRDLGRAAPVPISDPRLGQMQLTVDQRMSPRRGIGQERADLTVLDPSPRSPSAAAARPPSAHPSSGNPCHRRSAPRRGHETLDHVVPHIIADPVDIPVRPTRQPPHPVRRHLTGLLSQRPPILPFQTPDQPRHVLTRPSTRLGPGEPARDPAQLRNHKIHNQT